MVKTDILNPHLNLLPARVRHTNTLVIAGRDYFAVDQDSPANQLDIFQNDTDPNAGPIYTVNVTSPPQGSISYPSDATAFQYTPDSGFYGVDSFTCNFSAGTHSLFMRPQI